MALSKAGLASIIAASAVAAVLVGNEVVGGIVLDTPFAYNAEVACAKFKYFAHKNKDNTAVISDQNFTAVSNFVQHPRGAKLVATPNATDPTTHEVTKWEYELITEEGNPNAKAKSDARKGWKNIKKDKKLYENFKSNCKIFGCKCDWEAVIQFLKDQNIEVTDNIVDLQPAMGAGQTTKSKTPHKAAVTTEVKEDEEVKDEEVKDEEVKIEEVKIEDEEDEEDEEVKDEEVKDEVEPENTNSVLD